MSIVVKLRDKLGVSEDRVDLVILNNDVPCILIEEALGRGRTVFCRDEELCLGDVLRRLKICWDFEISYRKLGLLETAVEMVKRRWEC